MSVYGAKTPSGSRTTVCRLHSFSSCFLMRAPTPSPNRTLFGTTMPQRPPSLS